jgi:hypothetical protein
VLPVLRSPTEAHADAHTLISSSIVVAVVRLDGLVHGLVHEEGSLLLVEFTGHILADVRHLGGCQEDVIMTGEGSQEVKLA